MQSLMRPITVTLIRHGLTEWNAQGRAQGHAPVPLSEQGQEQARLLAGALRGQQGITALYSSDLLRCRQTAAPLQAVLGLELRLDERFREIDLGNWQGLGRAEWEAYDSDNYAAYVADPVNVPFPGGENRPMLTARVMAGLRDVAAAHPGEHVLVVTHGGPIRAVLRYYDHWPYRPWTGGSPPVTNTSRTTLEIAPDGRSAALLTLLDTSHLPEPLIS